MTRTMVQPLRLLVLFAFGASPSLLLAPERSLPRISLTKPGSWFESNLAPPNAH